MAAVSFLWQWFAGVWRTKLRSTWATTALQSLPSAADIYDQPWTSSCSMLQLDVYGSADQHQLTVPPCRPITFGRRAFSVAGPTVWNSLPIEFRCLSNSFDDFRRTLKTVLFAWYQCIQRNRDAFARHRATQIFYSILFYSTIRVII